MKKLVCGSCRKSEDLDNPSGDIRPMQLVDMSDKWNPPGTEETVQEDLCEDCRKKLRHDFFGVEDAKLLSMPLMSREA